MWLHEACLTTQSCTTRTMLILDRGGHASEYCDVQHLAHKTCVCASLNASVLGRTNAADEAYGVSENSNKCKMRSPVLVLRMREPCRTPKLMLRRKLRSCDGQATAMPSPRPSTSRAPTSLPVCMMMSSPDVPSGKLHSTQEVWEVNLGQQWVSICSLSV